MQEKYKFEFNLKEIRKILKGLYKLPYSDYNTIVTIIKESIKEQQTNTKQ